MWDTGIFPLCLTATGLCALLPRRCLNIHKTCSEDEGGVADESELKYPGMSDYPKGQNSLWVHVSAEKTVINMAKGKVYEKMHLRVGELAPAISCWS